MRWAIPSVLKNIVERSKSVESVGGGGTVLASNTLKFPKCFHTSENNSNLSAESRLRWRWYCNLQPTSTNSPNPSPRPRESLTYVLLYRLKLYWTFLINEILQYVVFDEWYILLSMFSRFVHVVTYVSSLFLFIGKWYSIVSIYTFYSLVCWYLIVSIFWPLWITLLWTFITFPCY